jgi:hypothetical protein
MSRGRYPDLATRDCLHIADAQVLHFLCHMLTPIRACQHVAEY